MQLIKVIFWSTYLKYWQKKPISLNTNEYSSQIQKSNLKSDNCSLKIISSKTVYT